MVNFYNILNNENNRPILNIKEEIDIDGTNMSIEESVEILNHFFDMNRLNSEHAYLIGFNKNMDIVGIFLISIGNQDKCYFYKKSIATFLLLSGSERFILYHNHPNDILDVSNDDILSMLTIKSLAENLEIEFIESVIITRNGWRCIERGTVYEYEEDEI